MSGIDFLDLVLQSSDSFILNAVLQICFRMIFSVYEVHVQLFHLWSCGSIVLFSLARLNFFYFFFSLNFSNGFQVKAMFSEGPFLCFLLVFNNFEFVPARGSPVRIGDHVSTSQESLKVEHVKFSLLSSSLAILQQF